MGIYVGFSGSGGGMIVDDVRKNGQVWTGLDKLNYQAVHSNSDHISRLTLFYLF